MSRANDPDTRIDAYLTRRGVADHLIGVGLDGLISRWDTVVGEVASGYTGGLDEYLNDLDLRQILGDVIAAVAETRGPLLARLREVDGRFVVATRPVDANLWGAAGRGDAHRSWWYFRVPLQDSGELSEDLAAGED